MRSFNVLMVDDDPAVCTVISTILKRQGHTVEVAENGKEAINRLTVKPGYFNVLITDHNMPLVSGLELVQYLRKNDYDGKIIVISGVLTPELLTAYRTKRVDKILQKPFTVENLALALKDTFTEWKLLAGEKELQGS